MLKSRITALALLLLGLAAPWAHAIPLDPTGQIRPDLLGDALVALEAHPEAKSAGRLVVVDYSKHSSEARLYVLDLSDGHVDALRTAHGAGSDKDHDGYLDDFSSVPGSNASPSGAFQVAEEYSGKHGRSVRLNGLDPENANARDRAIVVHAAAYAEPDFLQRYGKLGRSNGCIVFSSADLQAFLNAVPEGALVYIGR